MTSPLLRVPEALQTRLFVHFPAQRIVYEDEQVLVVDKPAGMSCHTGDPMHDDLVGRLTDLLTQRDGQAPTLATPQPLHRDQAGLVIVTRNRDAYRTLTHYAETNRIRVTVNGTYVCGMEFPQPAHGNRLRLTSPWARFFTTKGLPTEAHELQVRLETAALRRSRLARDPARSAFRLAHEDADELPGIALDVYGDFGVLHLRSDAAFASEDALADAAWALGLRGVYVKRHPREAHTLGTTRRNEVAPPQPIRGEPAADPVWVRENGARLQCRLGDGLATGLYLDQWQNRQLVAQHAGGLAVANLFAYTGAFSVAAAAGGATSTVTVDVARPALAIAEANLQANGFSADRHRCRAEDALTFLLRAGVRGDRFGLIVLDPPSFATTKTATFSVRGDYPMLAAAAFRVLQPRGFLLACTNHRKIDFRSFRRLLVQAAADAKREVNQMKNLPPPADVPSLPGQEPATKAVWIRLS